MYCIAKHMCYSTKRMWYGRSWCYLCDHLCKHTRYILCTVSKLNLRGCDWKDKETFVGLASYAFLLVLFWILFMCATNGTMQFTWEYLPCVNNYLWALKCMTKSLWVFTAHQWLLMRGVHRLCHSKVTHKFPSRHVEKHERNRNLAVSSTISQAYSN